MTHHLALPRLEQFISGQLTRTGLEFTMTAVHTVQLTPSPAVRQAAVPTSRNVLVKTTAPAVVTNATLPILLSSPSPSVQKLQATTTGLNGIGTKHLVGAAAIARRNVVRADTTPRQKVISVEVTPRQKFVSTDGGTPPRESRVSQRPGKLSAAASLEVPVSSSILCFGDSLTWGWVASGKKPVPYASFLQDMLGLPADSVLPAGQPGQKASDMQSRLSNELSRGNCFDGKTADFAAKQNEALQKIGKDTRTEQDGCPFDVVVVLAGANDLRSGAKAHAVIRDVLALHDQVRSHGAHCVAVTLTQCLPNDMDAKERQMINKALRDATAASSWNSGPSLVLADFDAEVSGLAKVQTDALFSDDVHFTEAGYRLLASVVNKAVASLVRTNSPLAARKTSPTVPIKQAPQCPVAAPTVAAEICATKKRPRAGSDCAAPPVRCIGRHLLYSQVPTAVLCQA